ISPYYMARIVDFPAFVADYPFKADETNREWCFSMTDPIMECNQGTFLLKISKDGKGEATKISGQCTDEISIQTMTTMLMGYKRPDYLSKIGRIQASEETIDILEDAIEQQTPYVSDYF
ncbi:MAG: sterol carrier protein domain-containing protein, partial [Bacillota bacterium]|nr:sterol carrier protein domain-containing protein [Bacillota bacterium]